MSAIQQREAVVVVVQHPGGLAASDVVPLEFMLTETCG
jgi:hypothetical protein